MLDTFRLRTPLLKLLRGKVNSRGVLQTLLEKTNVLRSIGQAQTAKTNAATVANEALRGPALQAALEVERARMKEQLLEDSEAGEVRTRLPGSTKVDGRFVIDKKLFPGWVDHVTDVSGVLKWKWEMMGNAAPMPSTEELDKLLPVHSPDVSALRSPPEERVQVTWLGHASCLVQWEGWTVLADPIFSERCSPMQWAGPKRVRPAPLQIDALPRVDAIVISHNHYDHLDLNTVVELLEQQPEATFFVPLGMKSWFEEAKDGGSKNVVEMDWGEEVVLKDEDMPALADTPRAPLTVVSVPCQHWCKRTPWDTNKCLWSSWIAKTDNLTYFFGGDTGYCGEVFKMAGDLYPVDLSAIPIAAYGVPEERWFHKPNHMDPEEAVKCHIDLKSKQSVGVHWGTFPLTSEPILEPPQRLREAVKKAGLGDDEFITLEHGETRVFDVLRRSSNDDVCCK